MRIASTSSFTTMNQSERAAVLAWANSHDWGAGAPLWTVHGLLVSVATIDRDGTHGTESYCATSMRDLRAWAGY